MRHNAYLYENDGGLAERMAPFLAEGLDQGDAVLTVVDRRKWELLQKELGPAAQQIQWIERDGFYTRPEDAIAGYDSTLRRLAAEGAAAVRAFAELPVVHRPEEWRAWNAYEAIVNAALAHHPMWVVCGYDARERPADVLEDALHTHPEVVNGNGTHTHYEDPEAIVRAMAAEPEELPGLERLDVGHGVRGVRLALLNEMAAAGVPNAAASNMLSAAGEVLANARLYGDGVVQIRAGRVGDRFVCELSDSGPGFDDPLAGHLPPVPEQGRGAGLWVARQLTARLDLLPSDSGLTARLWV